MSYGSTFPRPWVPVPSCPAGRRSTGGSFRRDRRDGANVLAGARAIGEPAAPLAAPLRRASSSRTLGALSIHTVHWLVLCGVVALAAAVFTLGSRQVAPAWTDSALLAYVPSNATFVLTADLQALRDSDLASLVPGGERDLAGIGKLSEVCGFDPTAEVRVLAVALRGAPAAGDEFGVILGGDFRSRMIADCARKVIAGRHGRPNERQSGPFVLLSGAGEGILAIREHGPVLLGDESVLGEMMRACERRVPTAATASTHHKLRAAIGAAPLVATWQPSAETAPESDRLLEELGALSYATGAVLALRVKPTVGFEALLLCESLEKCSELATSMNRVGRLILTDVLRSSLGSRELEVTVSSHDVRLGLALTARDLAALWAALVERL